MARAKIKRNPKMADLDPPESSSSWLGTFTRFWVATACILLILYIALLALARTPGFRDYLRDHIRKNLGMALAIDATSLSPDGRFTFHHLSLPPSDPAHPAGNLLIQTLTFDLSPRQALQRRGWIRGIQLAGGDITFHANPAGGWFPTSLSPLATTLDHAFGLNLQPSPTPPSASSEPHLSTSPPATSPSPEVALQELAATLPHVLTLRSLTLTWVGSDGQTLARIEGIDLDVEHTLLLDRAIFIASLRIKRAEQNRLNLANEVTLDLLFADGRLLPLNLSGDLRMGRLPGRDREQSHQRALDMIQKYAP